MQYVIKPFEALSNIELYNILQLRQEIFIIEQACIYPDIDHKDEHAVHLMAFDGDKLVGCLRVLEQGVSFPEASIGRIVVAEGSRGRGIAKEMLEQALDFMQRERGEKGVKISAQAYAIPLYERVGFAVVSDPYLEDDILHVDMLCELEGQCDV